MKTHQGKAGGDGASHRQAIDGTRDDETEPEIVTQCVVQSPPPVQWTLGTVFDEIRDDAETVNIGSEGRKGHERAIPPTQRNGIRDKPAGEQVSDGIHIRQDRRT